MPPAAFEDLWKTIQAGRPWSGLVKNRRKDGGFYWVHANVMPIIEDGKITEFASVRVAPTREQIKMASAIYDKINKGKLKGYKISQGQIVPTGWRKALKCVTAIFSRGVLPCIYRMLVAVIFLPLMILFFNNSDAIHPGWWFAWLGWASLNTYEAFRVRGKFISAMNGIMETARQIAGGNLKYTSNAKFEGEFMFLAGYLDMLRKSLTGIAENVSAAVQRTSTAVAVIKDSSLALQERTESQAAAIQETAASLEEITVTVRQNANNAASANQLSRESMVVAETGSQSVDQLISTMHEINASSKRIADIVNLIKDIAFQTNILAVNAAVEAARAGEQGKGFAVVAAEVRNLAENSGKAALQIKSLIDDSVRTMSIGSEQADAAGRAVRQIMESVQKVASIMDEFTASSIEQSKGLDQINQAIAQMDRSTQNNAEMVQDLSEISQKLVAESDGLGHEVSVLKR